MSKNSRDIWVKDFSASMVVFLVALPLCMGIAVASGLPPAKGLVTGVVGGLVVGALAGSPLQVSGPAAGLAVIVFEIVREHGISGLGPILILAGLFQFAAGLLRAGRWFRAISPAVIHGMLAGIGVLIVLQQFHVMLDNSPKRNGPENFLAMFGAIKEGIFPLDGSREEFGLIVGLLTIAIMILWQKYRPAALKLVPGALLGIVAATACVQMLQLPLKRVDVPSNLLSIVELPKLDSLSTLNWSEILSTALAVAFIASAETLLSAAAVDKMQTRTKTNYDRELAAQGVGNMLCGFLGALPMTGVIVRSSANVQAGAETRRSAILHGVWILAFISLLPGVLRMVPVCSLAAVLVYTGAKLVQLEHLRHMSRFGRVPILIYGATLFTIVAKDLLTGVLVGVGLSLAALVWKATHLSVRVIPTAQENHYRLILIGSATFLKIPQISAALDQVPHGSVVHAEIDGLYHIDHACLELLETWAAMHQEQGTEVRIEWKGLEDRYWLSRQQAA